MKHRLRILVHHFHADATKGLCDKLADLGCLMSHVEKTKFVPSDDLVVNWGCIKMPEKWGLQAPEAWNTLINHPNRVRTSTNRLKSLPIMKEAGVNVPEFTTKYVVASEWLGGGSSVIARKQIRSRSGHGLTFVEPGGTLPSDCALYVKYKPKRHEYRVHVFDRNVIDVQQKKRRKNFTGTVDPKIRSYDKGWVFCRKGIVVPECVVEQSLRAVEALGLDFGATDVGYNELDNAAMVYEVNTAPGLEGTSIQLYSDAIRKYYNESFHS